MLVVVALGTATVLTTAYLVSKDNSAAIGANAQDTAASSWVARSGADLALAVLQTQEDWVDADPEKLFEGFSIAGGQVSVVLTDLSGNPPDGTETEIAMTVVADVNGIKTVLQRIVTIKPDAVFDDAVDAELNEFGVYAGETFYSEPNSVFAPWPLSPAFKSGGAFKIGAGFTSSAEMTLDSEVSMSNVSMYARPDAQQTLKDMVEDPRFSGGAVLGVKIPTITPTLPTSLVGLPVVANNPTFIENNLGPPALQGGEYATMWIENDGTRIRMDDSTGGAYLIDGNLTIETGSVLEIEGDVTLGVMGKFCVQYGGTIELKDNQSRLRIYTADDVLIDSAGIGIPSEIAQDLDRDVSDIVDYVDPGRVRIYAISKADGGANFPTIELKNQAIANMVIHAPTSKVRIRDGSSLIGRATCCSFEAKRDGAMYYDQRLDPRTGYTALNGPLYQSNGDLQVGLQAALDSYDTSLGLDQLLAHLIANVTTEVVPVDVVLIGDPTPRRHDRAKKKHWPFVAKAIEHGSWVTGNHEERQESLYVPLDPSIFNLDDFYDDGVISATHVGQQALEDEQSQVAVPLGLN